MDKKYPSAAFIPAIIPSGNGNTNIRFHWEGRYYRVEMGNRMLDCVLDENQPEACSSGLRLTTNNIMGHLAEIRSAGDRYRASHPNDIRELKQLIAETSPERERLRSQAGWQRPQSGFGTPLNALKKD